MASSADPKRIAILALLLVAFAAVAVYRLRPALVPSVAVGGGKVAQVGSYTVPVLGWERGAAAGGADPSFGEEPLHVQRASDPDTGPAPHGPTAPAAPSTADADAGGDLRGWEVDPASTAPVSP